MSEKTKVLIVDDERVIAETLTAIFTQAGFETRCSHSAEEALELVNEFRPDFAIVDIVLPRMDGVELAILLESRCKCRTVVFTGQTITPEIVEDVKRRGYPERIMAKPVPPKDLLEIAGNPLRLPITQIGES